MDINIFWSPGSNANIADGFNVFYREYDPLGLNNWILANPTLLPYTATTYTITGLSQNTVYRVMVTKSCLGVQDVVTESTVVASGCPIIATWQGPVVNGYPTLFYSVYYPEGYHMNNARLGLYDTEIDDALPTSCPTPANLVVGRTTYLTADFCLNFNVLNCGEQQLDFLSPSNAASAVSYFGRDTRNVFPGNSLSSICNNGLPTVGGALAPLLLKYNNDYKFMVVPQIKYPSEFFYQDTTCFWYAVDVTPFSFVSDPSQTYPNLNSANGANISAAICFNNTTGLVNYTLADGLGRTDINNYLFSFTTSDGVTTIPLVNNSGIPVTSYNGSYNVYAPVKIQTSAPGGGNPLGYAITNAVTAGSNTTYTYTGGTNAFTVGQEVFVNSVNPSSFDFFQPGLGILGSRIITAATANTFTVSYTPSPASPYQTGGIVSGYLELTDGMTITVDLQPLQNVITLTNQNYTGLTLKQALDNIANSINTTTSYTASAVVIGGIPYLKINVPGTTYTSASIIFEGPNILTKGAPDILQTSEGGTLLSTNSSVNYNGFLYATYVNNTFSYAKIVASSYTNVPAAADYSHTINTGITELLLVPEAPPTTVYSLDRVASGGDYSLNITVAETPGAWNEGYVYIADNTTVSVYNGITLIDSKDISTITPEGTTKPIRLMEYNNTDNYLYIFLDGSSSNFQIILHTGVGSWSIGHTGAYAQTNYLQAGTITAWNNLTTGSTAAIGTMDSVTAPSIIPNPPNSTPLNSVTFQDNSKTGWNIVPPASSSFAQNAYYVYNSDQNSLGEMFYYGPPQPPFTYPGITGGTTAGTVNISRGVSTTGTTIPFLAAVNDNYGIFHKRNISDYNASPLFNDRIWANTSRYLIKSGRNSGSNGFLNTDISSITNTTFNVDGYSRFIRPRDKQINSTIGLDGTSTYLLYDITDGGTCYNKNNNKVFVSLDGGVVQVIPSSGSPIITIQLYKDFPGTTTQVDGSLQMVADPNSNLVYGIARDARSDVDDMNIYVFNQTAQVGVIAGSGLWDENICGQISIDSDFLYFTGKHTRNFYQYNVVTEVWNFEVVPSLYEKMDGFTYGTTSSLSRMRGVIERVQGASHIGGGKFVVMNYMQQTYSTELKYVYESSNLFVYDYLNNTIDQVLIGTGVNTYSGIPSSYNPDYYGEFFGMIDYNTDYCYGGLGIKVDSNGRIFWKKAVSDQIYMSESHTESGVAQIWGSGPGLIRIWNIQSNGSLQQSKRTIYDNYSTNLYNLTYDSFHQKVISIPNANSLGYQFNFYNPQNLAGGHSSPSAIGIGNKTLNSLFINGITPSLNTQGKPTYLYSVSATATEITFNVNPAYYNTGVFPHHYAVGDVITIVAGSVPALPAWIPTTNIIVTSITTASFTIANPTGNVYPLTVHQSGIPNVRLSQYWSATYGSVTTDNAGNVFVWIPNNGGNTPVYTSMFIKYSASDLFTQRESPKAIVKSAVSPICSATPDGIFLTAYTSLLNYSIISVTNQGTLWLIGSRNPICAITGITDATYDPLTQRIRYTIPNSFSVGKVVTITGMPISNYNLTRVPIVAADPAGFEISYTGGNPGTITLPIVGFTQVLLSVNWVIEVIDFTSPTLNTLATIDLTFANKYLDSIGFGSFQYSPAENKIYLYYNDSRTPVFIFDTITNSLIRSSSFNRMVLSYTKLSYVYTIEDVNGIAYFSAATNTDTPTRRWFRLTAGSRNYLDGVHNELNVSTTDSASATTVDTYDLYSLSNMSDTFGQWKEITGTTWDTIPNTISTTLGMPLEFTSFILNKPLVAIRNITQGTTYSPSNTLNSINVYTITADSINLFNGDLLEFEFTNPDNPSCPFINQSTITF